MGVVKVGACVSNSRSNRVIEVVERCNWPLGDLGGTVGEDVETFGETVPMLGFLVLGELCRTRVGGWEGTHYCQVLIRNVIVDSDPGGVIFPQMEGWARSCPIENDRVS